jgi:isoleucyl-tRNA synthetase
MILCRWAMHRMIDLHTSVQTALKVHNTGKALQLVHNCVANDLSALYFDSIKDTMCAVHVFPFLSFAHLPSRYCDSRMSPHRLGAQTMLWRVLRTLVQSFAPILPHLAEDVFQEAPVLFTHGSTFTHSEQSAKEYATAPFLQNIFVTFGQVRLLRVPLRAAAACAIRRERRPHILRRPRLRHLRVAQYGGG